MAEEAVFTMKLEAGLRDDFMREADAVDQPAAQVVRELMRDFIKRQRDGRAYAAFLGRKVDAARSSVHADLGRSNDAVEADFAATPRSA